MTGGAAARVTRNSIKSSLEFGKRTCYKILVAGGSKSRPAVTVDLGRPNGPWVAAKSEVFAEERKMPARFRSTLFVLLASFAASIGLAAAYVPVAIAQQAPPPRQLSPEEQDARLRNLLNGARLVGMWRTIDRNNGQFGSPRTESYAIRAVERDDADHYILFGQFTYEGVPVELPVRVKVLWAFDTPMIVVDNLLMPNGRTYAARVLFNHQHYAGLWSAPQANGTMMGRITTLDGNGETDRKKNDVGEAGAP